MANILSFSFQISNVDLGDSVCEHVQHGKAQQYAVFKEDDSFGPVGRFVVCKACFEEEQAKEQERTEVCDDCKQPKRKSVCGEWRWYDFYAAQGDEPLHICDDCRQLPRHKDRVVEDRRSRDEEELTSYELDGLY